MKPFSQACENNKDPILKILSRVFADKKRVLEVGSGTGQHAAYFSEHLPHLIWQPSDLKENHAGILEWLQEANLPNTLPPIELDADKQPWQIEKVDALFSANTLHIMSWEQDKKFFAGLPNVLQDDATVAIYGPFNYNGNFTSDSNRNFDQWLKDRGVHQGIRDFEKVNELAQNVGLEFVDDYPMPANNRLLVWNYWGEPISDKEFIAERIEAMEESVRYYSADNKMERERWVATTFLDNLNISHITKDIISPESDPPDVVIFGSDFEVKEVLDPGRRRHQEYKKELERIKSITDPMDLLTQYSPKDTSIENIFQRCLGEMRKLEKKYPNEVKQSLNLLFYVNLRHIHKVIEEPYPDTSVLGDFGWRSVSFVKGKIACCFYADDDAPFWLKENVGRILYAQN